jgi:RHS repeat-associated protein
VLASRAWPCLAVVLFVVAATVRPQFAAAQITPSCVSGCVTTVRVTPHAGTLAVNANTSGNTASFDISYSSSSTTARTFSFTCLGKGGIACGTVTPSSASLSGPDDFADVTVKFNAGTTNGTLTLTATSGSITDAGYYSVTVGNPGPPIVALRNHNADNLDRSLCLTAGAGEAAAAVCGDLVVTHALPGFSTMGRERTLTLLYNSRTAYYRPIITAAVSQPAGLQAPSAVYVELEVAGQIRRFATYGAWSNATRQIAVSYDAPGYGHATGVYPFTLRVQNQYTGGGAYTASVSGNLIVVNRYSSRFGAGVGIAGVEELVFNQPVGQPNSSILWVGGDGSAKLYAPAAPNRWVAPAGAYRDTLVYNPADTTYTRTLRHGVKVVFNSTGKHTRTVSRTNQTTTFAWNLDTLKSITVPPGGTTGVTYTFAYDNGTGLLDRISDPAGRILDATITGGQLSTIVDPDGKSVAFGYDGDRKMIWRRDRRQKTTNYEYGKTHRLTKVTIPVGRQAGDNAVAMTQFEPWDERGLVVGVNGSPQVAGDTSKAYTRILGPRYSPTLPDTSAFWVDRWGAPTQTGTPVPATTKLIRGDANVPALVTEVRYPNNRIVKMSYDLRGNLTQVRDSTKHLDQRPTKVRTYVYPTTGAALDSPIQVNDSLGTVARTTTYKYNSIGLTDTVIAPNGHRTSFAYKTGTLAGLLDSTMERATQTWRETVSDDVTDVSLDQVHRFTYDAKGNVKAYTSPVGVVTSYVPDAKGRITDVYDPLGTREERVYDDMNQVREIRRYTNPVAHPGTNVNPLGTHTALGRPCDATQVLCVDSTVAFNPALSANPQITTYTYDDNGAMESVTDARNLRRSFAYDARGLRWQSTDDYGYSDTTYLNGSGAPDSTVSRRGIKVRSYYDPSGRRTALAYPAVPSPDPAFAPATIVGDSIRYEYDVMGNVKEVRNNTDSIVREYFADGSLKRKISSVGPRADTVSYDYDATGAVTKVTHGRDVTDYAYSSTTGELQTMTVTWGGRTDAARVFSFVWDALGRRRQITYPTDPAGPNDMTVKFRYDAAGMLRRVVSSHPGAPGGNAALDVFDFTFRNKIVDAAGRIWRQELSCAGVNSPGNPCGAASAGSKDTKNQYNRFGMLMRQEVRRTGYNPLVEDMQYDGSGNMIRRGRWDPALAQYRNDTFLIDSSATATHNQLKEMAEASNREPPLTILYTADGARKWEKPYNAILDYRETYYYYDGLGRMAGSVERDDEQLNTLRHHPGSCVYDPDGQLALACNATGGVYLAFNGHNVSGLLYTPTVAYPDAGWSFVHGPGTDDPLTGYHRQVGLERIFYFVTDGQGRILAVADSGGARTPNDVGQAPIARWSMVGGISDGHSFNADRQSGGDVPNLSFFRNRAYDMTTGRFTQEDPIGVAGGLNLYQYAGNNPVSYTDPFGLCPEPPGSCQQLGTAIGSAVGLAVGVLVSAAADVGSGGTAIPANPAIIQTTTLAGATIGLGIGTVMEFAGSGRSKNDIPLTGQPPNTTITKPGQVVRVGPDGNATSRTCGQAGHGCDGAHTHTYTTGPNGKVNQVGQPRPATPEEAAEVPPRN